MDGGILLIDKPAGPTSHDVVQQVRRKLQTRKVGHAGTLDPMATGLLLICVGDATRVLEYMTSQDKTYTGQVVFGIATETDDAHGEVTQTASTTDLTDEAVQEAVTKLTGTIQQVVPRYSAVHINGRRAYELARAGEDVEMPSRTVHIASFEVSRLRHDGEAATADFAVSCSKGTYIRSLCRDLGALVGLPAHMAYLRRTKVGAADISQAISLDGFMEHDNPAALLQPPLPFLTNYKVVEISKAQLQTLANGGRVGVEEVPLDANTLQDGELVVVTHLGQLALIAHQTRRYGKVELQPKKVFWKRG